MAPRVPFLQQLAPTADRGGAFVRAAVPSRFAPQTFGIEETSQASVAGTTPEPPTQRASDSSSLTWPVQWNAPESPAPTVSRPERAAIGDDGVERVKASDDRRESSPIVHERVVERTPL